MVYALYFSDRRVKAKRKSELRKLLHRAELEIFSEVPGVNLDHYPADFTQELEEQMARGHCYLFAQEPHKGRFVRYPDQGQNVDRAPPSGEVFGGLVFETVKQWEDFVTFAPTDSEGEEEEERGNGPKRVTYRHELGTKHEAEGSVQCNHQPRSRRMATRKARQLG